MKTINKKAIAEKVSNGVKFLNTYYPNWFKDIDINNIVVNCKHQCIIGQVTRESILVFRDKYDILFCIEHGFLVPDNLDYLALHNYHMEWDKQIKRHRESFNQ